MRHRWTALVLIAVCGLAAGPASAEDLGAAIRDGAPERIVEALNGYQGLWGEQPPDDPVVRRAQARILDLELSRLGPLLSGLRVPLHGGEVFEALDRRGRRSGREGAAFASVLLARERAADGGVTLLDDETRLMLATNRARLRRANDLGPERERASLRTSVLAAVRSRGFGSVIADVIAEQDPAGECTRTLDAIDAILRDPSVDGGAVLAAWIDTLVAADPLPGDVSARMRAAGALWALRAYSRDASEVLTSHADKIVGFLDDGEVRDELDGERALGGFLRSAGLRLPEGSPLRARLRDGSDLARWWNLRATRVVDGGGGPDRGDTVTPQLLIAGFLVLSVLTIVVLFLLIAVKLSRSKRTRGRTGARGTRAARTPPPRAAPRPTARREVFERDAHDEEDGEDELEGNEEEYEVEGEEEYEYEVEGDEYETTEDEGDDEEEYEEEDETAEDDESEEEYEEYEEEDEYEDEDDAPPPPPDSALSVEDIRQRIEKTGFYTDIKWITGGGTAWIYRAQDRASGQLRALKVLDPAHRSNDNIRKKLSHEGDILQDVHYEWKSTAGDSNGVAPVVVCHRNGLLEGAIPYLDLEYVDGADLHHVLEKLKARGQRLSVRTCLGVIRRFAWGLSFAHARHYFHRDVKPGNLLVPKAPSLAESLARSQIADFGIARDRRQGEQAWDGLHGEDAPKRRLRTTEVTGWIGTPEYMAPEQFDPKFGGICPQTDIYSLGVLLFELVTGNVPYQGRDVYEFKEAHTTQAAPMIRGITNDVQLLIHGMLAKSPTERVPGTAADLVAEIDRILESEEV